MVGFFPSKDRRNGQWALLIHSYVCSCSNRVDRMLIYRIHKQKELTSTYQTSTLELMYSQFASRRKTVCCTIASLTSAVFFNKVGQNLPITRGAWL